MRKITPIKGDTMPVLLKIATWVPPKQAQLSQRVMHFQQVLMMELVIGEADHPGSPGLHLWAFSDKVK